MRSEPLVSVVTIFLDCRDYLAEAIDSVLAQTWPHWELLLVDDGSSDGSSEIAQGYAARMPERVRYLTHPDRANRGMSASRNLGFREARGVYLALIDGDDVWLPHKLERQVAVMEAEPELGMVYGRTEYWHGWTGLPEDAARDHTPEFSLGGRTRFDPPELLTLNYPLGESHAPCLCGLLIRTEVARRVGGFEESFTGFYEDQAFLSKMYLESRIGVMDGCHDRYRIHDRSCSAIVRRAELYDRYRETYLRWLERYLEARGDTPAEVARKLEAALEPYRARATGGSGVQWLRLLRVADGNAARLELSEADPDRVRVAITHLANEVPYDIQLNLPRLRAREGERFVLAFAARADSERTLGVGFADGRTPWENLGLFDVVQLTPEWRHFTREFTAPREQEDARIHFDLGGHAASVELTGVSLFSLLDGAVVRPDLPGNRAGPVPAGRPVQVGGVDFGDLRRLQPISPDFGCDRGGPVDRHYIERFLSDHAGDVRGRVLEVGERTYTKRFGGDRVTKSDVLHVHEGEPEATIIADLADAEHIPSNAFDCVILTQTLQLIYDLTAAVRTLHRILEPGGVLLVTIPGISQTYDSEWGGTWYWNFTHLSARRLFEETFGAGNVEVETRGNVLTAISFLHGLAAEELSDAELEHRDPGYHVTITVRAVKRSDTAQRPKGSYAAADPAIEPRASAGTGPTGRAAATVGGARPLVLMYHRVSSGHADPWSLCVSPERFREHLEVLASTMRPMTLAELLAATERGDAPENAVALTFDDGYADNLLAAAPLLADRSVPATFFVSAGPWAAQREFWWDELEGLVLGPGDLPPAVRATIGARERAWELGDARLDSEAARASSLSWKAGDPPPTIREALFLELWRLLQPLSSGRQEAVLDELRAGLGRPLTVRPSHRRLSPAEVAALAVVPGAEIGGHTATHPVLPVQAPADARWDLATNKRALESIVGGPVTSFAYPYGAHSDETVALVREAGFTSACTTEAASVARGGDPLRLPRMAAQDWSGEELARRLELWSER